MQRDRSWSCRPIAETLPRSSTRMASASISVDSRCETMMTVRPSPMRRRFCADDRLAVRIERARRLVEDEQARIGDERAGDREALLLAAREVRGVLLEHRVEAARQTLDELLGAGRLRAASTTSSKVALGLRRGDVLAHRAAEQEAVLQHDADGAGADASGRSRGCRSRRCARALAGSRRGPASAASPSSCPSRCGRRCRRRCRPGCRRRHRRGPARPPSGSGR